MKLASKNRIIYSFLLLFFVIQVVDAQYTHYFKNYTLSDYKASNQNWDISKSNDGKLFVANNDGLLEFDGLNWNLWEMPNKAIIRSLLIYQNRIYVGSYEEFGYFLKNPKGVYEYHSLIKLLDKFKIHEDEEFWQIILFKGAIVFRSFLSIHILEDDKISSYNLPSIAMSCNVVEGKLYVSTLDKGIFILENKNLIPFFNHSLLQNTKIISLTKTDTNQLLISTALSGLFLLDHNKIVSWKTAINPIIKKYQLNKFSQLPSGDMVFGTIKNGIYITDKDGEILFHLNKEVGLLNNTILGQSVSKGNELWLGLDNGLASIDLDKPNFFYTDVSGKLGAVYDIINYKGIIYIGSNTGLYFLDNKNKLNFIEGSQGQVWNLKEVNGELFCGHNNGTYLLQNKQLKLISNFAGGWVLKKVPEEKDFYIQGTYVGLVSFNKLNGKWKATHLGKTTIPIKYLVFENKTTAWVAHASKGLYRVKFNKNYDSIVEFKDFRNKGLWSDFFVKIYKINNTIAFHTNKGWQMYEPLLDSILPFNLLNDKEEVKDGYIISEDDIQKLAFKYKNSINFDPFSNGFGKAKVSEEYFKKRLITGNENISKINDSTLALNLYDGFMLINTANLENAITLKKPIIEKLSINNKAIDLKTDPILIPFGNNNITINVSSPLSSNHTFEYQLSNFYFKAPWVETKNGILEFSNLSDGSYTLLINTKGSKQSKSSNLRIDFKVLSPWYKDTFGFIIYALLLLLSALTIYFLHKRKIKKEQNLLKIKYSKTQKKLLDERARENEKEIIKLKNESLENEVNLKSKQLANSAMALIKKNETLQHLKESFIKHKENFNNQYLFKNLIKQLDDSIEHKDEWELFEYNFNQVHEAFFNQLKAQFSELNKKDLKACAYIKMNLTTKEISTLFNISIRGVETLRYRLKGKLNLAKSDSLKGFLQNFN